MHSPNIPADMPAAGPISVPCPCGKTLVVKPQLAGKKIRCPDCERVLVVPLPVESRAAETTIVPDQTLPHSAPTTAASAQIQVGAAVGGSAKTAIAPPAVNISQSAVIAAAQLRPSELAEIDNVIDDELPTRGNRLAMLSVAVIVFGLALAWLFFIRNPNPAADDDAVLKAALASSGLPAKHTSTMGMEFVLVPKGKFLMGGYGGIPGVQEVAIPENFYLGTYEVTQSEWEKVLGEDKNVSAFSPLGAERHVVTNITPEAFKRFPVERVTWDDCQAFLKKLNEMDPSKDWTYRLPTEVEWEYACRGGPYKNNRNFGFDYYLDRPTNSLSKEQANVNVTEGLGRTCKVGSYPPNRLGLYDMHGNVLEWCDDRAMGSLQHTRRGGAYTRGPEHCRAASRLLYVAIDRRPDHGLRVARVPVAK